MTAGLNVLIESQFYFITVSEASDVRQRIYSVSHLVLCVTKY
jgi:hypothetical protein